MGRGFRGGDGLELQSAIKLWIGYKRKFGMTQDEFRSLYQKGVEAARSGDKVAARKLFRAASALDAGQKKPWLALAQLETDADKKAAYYQRVLSIDAQDAVARAYISGMAAGGKTQSGGRRWLALGGILVMLLAFGAAALFLTRPAGESSVLPTLNALPSITATVNGEIMALQPAANVTAEPTTIPPTNAPDEPAATSTNLPPQANVVQQSQSTPIQFVLPSPSATGDVINNSVIVPAAATNPVVSTPPIAPTVVVPTNRPPVLVTAAPSGTAQPTNEPLEVTVGPSPTGFPTLFTETPSYLDNLNTAIAPTDAPFEVDPNAGSGRNPPGS